MNAFSNFQLFATCVAIWGTTWLAITFQLGSVAPEISVGYRFVIASAAMFAYCRWRGLNLRHTLRQHVELLFFGASMFCISYVLVYYAETYIVSGVVAVAYSAGPMINMLMARVLFSTPMTSRVVTGAIFGIMGIVCVFWHEFSALSASRSAELGATFAILAVLFSSVGSMLATRMHGAGNSTWSNMAWGMFYGGTLALVFGLATGRPLNFEFTYGYVGSLLYLAILGSVAAFACYLTLQGRIGAARASYIGVMTPIIALIVSFLFEKFVMGWLTVVGISLSVVGNVVMLRGKSEPKGDVTA